MCKQVKLNLDDTAQACVCDDGYNDVGGVCLLDDSSGGNDSTYNGSTIVINTGGDDDDDDEVNPCANKSNSTWDDTTQSCVCDWGYNDESGVCVLDTSDDGTDTALSICQDSGGTCLLYTSPSPRDATLSRMPSSA